MIKIQTVRIAFKFTNWIFYTFSDNSSSDLVGFHVDCSWPIRAKFSGF